MTAPNDATKRQRAAADPNRSTWLSANAGSGKTRVLTDRVARLLLQGVEPQRILCLTYTKAAASEMQNRLFARLGAWAMLDDAPLRQELTELGVSQTLDDAALSNARTLFARAIETPGGLKIQTIHSFCGALLRRFPLEAGVSPQFTEIEDRAGEILRGDIVDDMASGPDARLVADLAAIHSGENFIALTQEILSEKDAFAQPFDRAALLDALNQSPTLTFDALVAQVFEPGDGALIKSLSAALKDGGVEEKKSAELLSQISALESDSLPVLEKAFLTAAGTVKKRVPTKKFCEEHPDLEEPLRDLMERICEARDARLALQTAEQSAVLHAFAVRFLSKYEAAKTQRAWLDFDDLIEKARALLSDSTLAGWVLFRIDGGIDHILVDEAQDTSPSQWDVIRKLAEEFAAGEGARSDVQRTLFVVGDQKQSIYSFQGADPRAFDEMRDAFDRRLSDSGNALQKTQLEYSFRSSPAILHLVDQVFADCPAFPANSGHIAFHDQLPGRVDVWDFVESVEKPEDGPWNDPVDLKTAEHHHRVLARQLAERVKAMLEDETALIPTRSENGTVYGKRIEPKDILILVRRRTGVFHNIIQALKEANLPVAGSDRLRVGAELAVKDIGALLSFLATQDDDLSLAAALRSPLFGWSEQDLYTLAHGRGKQTLWARLRNEDQRYPRTLGILKDLRKWADILRPYDLIERLLTRHEGRKRLLGRLGQEAEDGIDALLTQALSYERANVPSLTGFLVWMETDDLVIKRQIDSASNQIRIMTVHGAKGLEAPIVILPECEAPKPQERGQVRVLDGQAVWRPASAERCAGMAELAEGLKQLHEEEALRLLYVALTRAEKWLIVAGSGKLKKDEADWYHQIKHAAEFCGATALPAALGGFPRLEYGDWSGMTRVTQDAEQAETAELEPFFHESAPTPPARDEVISPSGLDGAKALPGEGMDEDTALAYGTFVHLLLERLPQVAPDLRDAFFQSAADKAGLPDALAEDALVEARRVYEDPDLVHLFGSESLAEVPITAWLGPSRMHGLIDRLIVTDTHVLAVDFKSNRQVPKAIDEMPAGVLRQLGAYAVALSQIYPEHDIRPAVLWTRTAQLMEVPHDMVMAALLDPRYLDAPALST